VRILTDTAIQSGYENGGSGAWGASSSIVVNSRVHGDSFVAATWRVVDYGL
jgi:hypothetical protein